MNKFLLYLVLIIFSLNTYSQEGLNMRLNSINDLTADAIYVDGSYAYIIGSTLDTLQKDVVIGIQDTLYTAQEDISIGKFYKVNLETNMIEDLIKINSSQFDFDIKSSKIYNINDTLHYFTLGREFIDTIIQNPNSIDYYPEYYHHFRYSLMDGKWENETFPAYNKDGSQYVGNLDAYISESGIYLSNRIRNVVKNYPDVLITKFDLNNKVVWNNKFENQPRHLAIRILEDKENKIVFTGIIDSITPNGRQGYRHLFIQKIDSNDGSFIKKFVLEENSTLPKAFIEDPRGGYIVGSGDAVFQGGGTYPSITQILKIDKNLDSICWRISLSDSLSYSLFWQLDNFTFLGNNEFMAVGISDDPLNTRSNVGRIIKFTGDGEVIFDKEVEHYSPNDNLEQRIRDISPYEDGFIACGTIRHYFKTFDFPDQQGWILYIDKNGNADISSSTNSFTNDKSEFDIYPNPTTGKLILDFEKDLDQDLSYIIYSIHGIEIQRGTISKGNRQSNIQIVNSVSGLYVLRLGTKKNSITKLIHLN